MQAPNNFTLYKSSMQW